MKTRATAYPVWNAFLPAPDSPLPLREQLLRFLRDEHEGDAGIVYCQSRRKVEETADWLNQQGITALPYHAGLAF